MKITRKAEKLIMLTRGEVDRAMTLIPKNKIKKRLSNWQTKQKLNVIEPLVSLEALKTETLQISCGKLETF